MRQRSSRGASRGAKGAPSVSALDAGLRLLGRRAHSERELWRKLGRRGYEEAEVRTALVRLAELGYLDDQAFAEGHVRRRSASLGPLALSAELAARGVDRGTAGRAVAAFDPEAQLASARRLVERLYGRRPWSGYREMIDSIGPRLVRRGFPPGVVRAACGAVWAGTGEQAEA